LRRQWYRRALLEEDPDGPGERSGATKRDLGQPLSGQCSPQAVKASSGLSSSMSSVGPPTPEFGKSTRQKCLRPGSAPGFKKQLQPSRINAVSNLQSFPKQDVTGSSTVSDSKPFAFVHLRSPFHRMVRIVHCSRCPVDSTDDFVKRHWFASSPCPSSSARRLPSSHNQMRVVTTRPWHKRRRTCLPAKSRFPQIRRLPGRRDILLSCIHTPAAQRRDILAVGTVTKYRGWQSHWCVPGPTASPQ